MSPESEDGEIVPILQKSLLERIPALVDELQAADMYLEEILAATEADRKHAYARRKAARNRLAECLKGLGLDGFSLGGDR